MNIELNFPAGFSNDRKNVCVQGLGFVGSAMSLAVAVAKNNLGALLYNVIGIDLPNETGLKRVDFINKGVFPFESNDENLHRVMKEVTENKNVLATIEPKYFSVADVIIVDINLDVKYYDDGEPFLDLNAFKNAMHTIGKYAPAGVLIIVETTVPPGTCEKVVYPIVKEEFYKRQMTEKDFFVAHSYERVMPGKDYFNSIVNFWRVYSGIDEFSAEKCEKFLKTVISTEKYPLTRLEKTTATEISKVLENSYRAVTIAFMEEWGRFAEEVGVNLFEVIDAIRFRPTHSNMRQPGFGVGGYCLTKDPYFAYLASKELFNLSGMEFPFCRMAVKANNAMPLVSLDKIEKIFGGSLSNKKILVLGVTYRQDVGDTRYSPTEIFVKEALRRGAKIYCQDPLVSYWEEMKIKVQQDIPPFTNYDVIVFTVQHVQYATINFKEQKFNSNTLIFDANKVLSDTQISDIKNNSNVIFSSIGRG